MSDCSAARGRNRAPLAAEGGAERVNPGLAPQVVAVRRIDVEDLLRGVVVPVPTLRASIVRRCGWYQAVPSESFTPVPESIIA